MQVICLGLLIFSLTWAAPTFQPQTEKTKQGCVEEQKITYKDHHGKHDYYIFKYVYASSGRKNPTDIKEEKNKDNIALHHFGKRRKQEPSHKNNVVQEREKDLSLFKLSENNQSRRSQNILVNRQTPHKDHSISKKENVHNDLKMSVYPESTENKRVINGDDAFSELHDQEEYGAALIRNNVHHLTGPVTITELLREKEKEKKPRNVLSKIFRVANYAKASLKDSKNHQRDAHAQNIPVKSKSPHHIQHITHYIKQLPKVKTIPSDFEGSGYTDLKERGDNDISPSSGDGWPFEDIPGKEEGTGPDLEGTNSQTGFSGPTGAQSTNLDTRGPGYNEIPEKKENGGNAIGTRDATTKGANAAGVSLVAGSNDIIGSTNFKELPGKEGNRVDSGSQNAHRGKVEFHYPHEPSKGKRKESSSAVTKSTNYNEIPKNGKGSTQKGTERSDRNQEPLNERQRFSGKGNIQGPFIASSSLDNEIKHEVGSHNGPTNEKNTVTHNHGRKSHYVPHRQNNALWNKGKSQRKGSWNYRRSHSNRNSPRRKDDSSESSESDSSSDSSGD
ncbi:matrix extracellular phosphoglycoprotein [Orycteropus afer afer]|uniref:Matrix extracellular phosphoglycoprotein n=1 Tax=Orycteropus afer afer TaxID=1230840 RepID=A0A8B7APH5_ORYAF|nr:matrix extracellular phosphoglycoprotein [Orycteropus afer afer]